MGYIILNTTLARGGLVTVRILSLLLVVLGDAAVLAQDPLPPPTPQAQAGAETTVREVFKEEFAKRSPKDRQALARRLLEQGRQATDDPPVVFVLLKMSREMAIEIEDLEGALEAARETAKQFKVKHAEITHETLDAFVKRSKETGPLSSAATAYLRCSDEEARREDFGAAVADAKQAVLAARKAKDTSLVAAATSRLASHEELQREFQKVQKASQALADGSATPGDKLAVGRFQSFVKGDWKLGLLLLADGADEELKTLAALDLTNPADPKGQTPVGDAWMSFAEKQSREAHKVACQIRAKHWYTQALPLSTGLARIQLEKKLLKGANSFKAVVWNSHNGRYRDRGTLEFALSLVDAHGAVLWERQQIALAWKPDGPSNVEVFLQCASRPQKVVVEITKAQGSSAALAEVELFNESGNLLRGASVTTGVREAVDSKQLTDGITYELADGSGDWYSDSKTARVEIAISAVPSVAKEFRPAGANDPKAATPPGLFPGLLVQEYPRVPEQEKPGFVPLEKLGLPAGEPYVVSSLNPWTKTGKDRNAVARGFLKISVAGEYSFNSRSFYDRDQLLIGGKEVCGYRDGEETIKKIRLQPGLVPIISVGWFSDGRDTVNIRWMAPGDRELTTIPESLLFHQPLPERK